MWGSMVTIVELGCQSLSFDVLLLGLLEKLDVYRDKVGSRRGHVADGLKGFVGAVVDPRRAS